MSVFKLGLTGSIGMGKSTTAKLFEESGCFLWDADAAVHRLYEKNGLAVGPMSALFPEASFEDGVSRDALKALISKDPKALQAIEAVIHPLVRQDRQAFIANLRNGIAVFDVPLLFETGGDADMDAVVCVHVPSDVQRARVLARGTMSEAQFELIKNKQMPIEEKLARADYHVLTDTLDHARVQVVAILEDVKSRQHA